MQAHYFTKIQLPALSFDFVPPVKWVAFRQCGSLFASAFADALVLTNTRNLESSFNISYSCRSVFIISLTSGLLSTLCLISRRHVVTSAI